MMQTGLCIDKAHFSLFGSGKTKNCHIRTRENLHALVEKSLHDLKLTVWCSFKASSVIEFVFLREKSGNRFQTVTVKGDGYGF